jgi:hypothetical protein
MKRKQAMAQSIVETLAEKTEGTGLPSGHMYAALMGLVGLSEFQAILAGLENVGLVTVNAHYVCATPKARALIQRGGN